MSKAKSILYFSPQEKKDLIISWLSLSIAFTIVIRIAFEMDFITATITSLIAVGTGFVFHELAHREAAKKFGFQSEYRAWYPGLIIAIGLAIVTAGSFLFAAPGATYFLGENVSRKQNGVISIAGPITNLVIGLALILLSTLFMDKWIVILLAASAINFSLALFNMLPIYPLDGAKVLAWNPAVWIIIILIAGILALAPGLVLPLIGIKAF